MTLPTYGQLRQRAAQAAWARIRHLLRPETVHLLTEADLVDAITAACDILAPAEQDAMARMPVLIRELDLQRRAYLSCMQERDQAERERDEATGAADELACALATLVGQSAGRHSTGRDAWLWAMDIIDQIAEANGRDRPSGRYDRKVAAA